MSCKIVFAKNDRRKEITLTQVSEIVIESSWAMLTSTAEIVIPRNVQYFKKHDVMDVFAKGDEVIISFGYDGLHKEEFRGYVTEVSTEIPIKIKFQDEMWKLKQIPVNYSSSSVSLTNLLSTILPGYKIDALDGVEMGSVRFPQTTASEVLEKLKQDPWKLVSYFKLINGTPVLVCGKHYSDDEDKTPVAFHLERNCVSNSLNYLKKDDISILIKGVSTLNDGNKIEFEFGDKGGQPRQLVHYNKNLQELEILVKLDYQKYKQDKFSGSFTAFGIPSVRHGMRVALESDLYEDRKGTYLIEGVTKTFNSGGIRQVIKLDQKFN